MRYQSLGALAPHQAPTAGWMSGNVGSGLPGTKGCGLNPVLAGRRAEPSGPVPRCVDVYPVATISGAHPEAAVQLAAKHDGQASGAAGRPAGDERVIRTVKLQ